MSKRIETEFPFEVKDCPFCGRSAQIVFEDKKGKPSKVHVECRWCGCRTSDWSTRMLREYALVYAVEFWNRREKVENKIVFG